MQGYHTGIEGHTTGYAFDCVYDTDAAVAVAYSENLSSLHSSQKRPPRENEGQWGCPPNAVHVPVDAVVCVVH